MRDALPDSTLLGAFSAQPGMAPSAPTDASGGPQGPAGAPDALYYRAKRKPRFTRSDDKLHPWEAAALEVQRWMAEMPEQIADAVMPQGRAPFAADAPAAEQVDYWLTQFLLPDGTLNTPAVQAFLADTDPQAIRALAKAIRQRRGQEEAQA